MKARRTPAFRERKRFELRQEARASRTLRRYGYCEADLWTAEEIAVAEELIKGLRTTASEQRERLRSSRRTIDLDTWLWGQAGPDFVAELGREVVRFAGAAAERKAFCERVAARLLDHRRVRVATQEESAIAARILANVGAGASACGEAELLRLLTEKAFDLAQGNAGRSGCFCAVARKVARRISARGAWDDRVDDDVPPEIQPLHMSEVREALGALIPEHLHKNLDKAAQKVKDDFGVMRGGSVLFMNG